MVALCAGAEEVIKENNAIDIYEQYWEGDDAKYSTEAAAAHTLTQLLDPSPSRRGAQYLCWHPDGSRKVLPLFLSLPAPLAVSWNKHSLHAADCAEQRPMLRIPRLSPFIVCMDHDQKSRQQPPQFDGACIAWQSQVHCDHLCHPVEAS